MRRSVSLVVWLTLCVGTACAGGPRWVQGSAAPSPGTPITWGNGGVVDYYTDLGNLSATVNNSAANAMVAAAFAPWNAVTYSTVNLQPAGVLNENVSGNNVYIDSSSGTPVVAWPADADGSYTAKPLAVIYDEDGSIIDLLLGTGASSPLSCNQNGVLEDVDNVSSAGVIQHARLILNGRCAGSSVQMQQMQYELMRMAGRILGLDWSQTNDDVFTDNPLPTYVEEEYWPVMHPMDILCGPYTFQCMVNPFTLRMDDAAALGRLYPVTTANLAANPGKSTLANASMNLYGDLNFPSGQGMQGVNVLVREALPYQATVTPTVQAMVSGVSGYAYTGDFGNPVGGFVSADGAALPTFGTSNSYYEGQFNLQGYVPNPPAAIGWDIAVLFFEPINPLYVGEYSVGPYTVNTVMPAGTMPTAQVPFAVAGRWQGLNVVTVSDAPDDSSMGAGSSWAQPQRVASNGWWNGRLGAPQETAWYSLNLQANRTFTVEVNSLDESGNDSANKLMPSIGLWDATDAESASPEWSTTAFNGLEPWATSLVAETSSAETMRLAIADERGAGRPDFNYQARVLYADNLQPAMVATAGGALTINGMGFRAGNEVQIGGVTATVLSVTDSQMVVQAPALSSLSGVSAGTAVDVEVSDATTGGVAIISGGLTYVANSSSGSSGSEEFITVSGGGQQISESQSFVPVVLQLISGTGVPISGTAIQVSQSIYGWQEPCSGPGRCATPPLLKSVSTSFTTDGSGKVSIPVLQLANTAESTTMVATAGTAATTQIMVTKNP